MEFEAIIRLGSFAGMFLLMAAWELAAPRRGLFFQQKGRRWLANLSLVVFNTVLLRAAIPAGAAGAAIWAESAGVGLLHLVDTPGWLAIVISVLLFDLAIYGQHVAFHAFAPLWRLHMVHHADRDVDVTTGLRFHPIEILLSMLFKMGIVVLLGAPALAVLIFEVLLNGMAMFNHANVSMPKSLDAVLRLLVVTPDMHRVHHSVERCETNSNYGFNLSCWDRIFGSYRAQPQAGHERMTIGLEQFLNGSVQPLAWMLRLPFTGTTGNYPIFRRKM